MWLHFIILPQTATGLV